MKKIINGKKYDTETAKCVGYWSNGRDYYDIYFTEERLYRKKTGEFFLETYSEEIIPLSEDEAKEWAENHLDGDTYEEIFGPVEE